MAISWRLIGNRDLAAHYRGEANRLRFHLNAVLGETPSGGMNRVYPDGTTIFLRKFFDNEIVLISSPFPTGGAEQIIKQILVFLYTGPKDKMFYLLDFPDSLDSTEEPPDFDHTDENSNVNLGSLGYVINKDERKDHIITIGTPYENWDLVQDSLTDAGLGKFPIMVAWNVPAGCVHAHIRGGSEEAKWGTCGYSGDAIVPPEHSMSWPFRSILSFSYSAKKRTMNPIYGCWVPIKTDDVIVWQEDPQYTGPDWGISGKRNFKLNEALSEALSWRDTLQVSGVGITNSTGYFDLQGYPAGGYLSVTFGFYPYPSPAFCWKPWYSWLHEVPTFDYFDADSYVYAAAMISDGWNLQPRPPYKYRRKYKTVSGELIQDNLFAETLNHHYNPAYGDNSYDSWTDGRCTTDMGDSHSYDVASGGYGGSSSGNVYTVIASLGDGKYLYIENFFAASMSHEGNSKTGTLHKDNLPCNWTACQQNFQLDCACNDQYFNPELLPGYSHHDIKSETWGDGIWDEYKTKNNIILNQNLLFDASTIEQCSNTLAYTLDISTFTGSYTWWFAHADPVQWGGATICPAEVDSQGSESQNDRGDKEKWTRTQQFVEVLDYDNVGTDTAIVIYKKVAISHSVTFDYRGKGTNVPALDFPYSGEKSDYVWGGTRTVTYWVWVKIGDSFTMKFQIPHTFIGSCSGVYFVTSHLGIITNSQKTESQTGSGQRIYGVSCQINDDFIVYSYAVEDFAAGSAGYGYYSSPLNWEDRDRQGINMDGFPVWKKNKMVLGVVNIETHERNTFDITEFTDRKVYSVGMHDSERVEVQI